MTATNTPGASGGDGVRGTRARKSRARFPGVLLNVLLVLLGLVMLAPFYWLFLTSLLPGDLAFSVPPVWFSTDLTGDAFAQVFELIPFVTFVWNSVKLAAIVTIGGLVVATLAAYAFARLRFPGRDVLFLVLLAAMMLPPQVTVVPTFMVLRTLGLVDHHEAVYLPQLVNVLAIFLLRQWFRALPRDLEDAARIDGCGHLRTLRHVIVPLSGPPLAALAIFLAQASWNDFFWPNIMLSSPEKLTLPVGMVYLQGEHGTGSPVVIFAAISMVVLPVLILFVFAQRPITESLAMTGIRG